MKPFKIYTKDEEAFEKAQLFMFAAGYKWNAGQDFPLRGRGSKYLVVVPSRDYPHFPMERDKALLFSNHSSVDLPIVHWPFLEGVTVD